MAPRYSLLRLALCLALTCQHCASQQQQHSSSPQQTSSDDGLLLSSLSTIVTSGSGFAVTHSPRQLQLPGWAGGLNSSVDSSSRSSGGAPSNHSFEPTPPHKPLWPNWTLRDVWLFALSAVTLFIAAGGGIGGGAVFVPLYIIVGGFTAAQAVALSNITILGGAAANFIANSTKRHAFRDGPLIDWDLILVMEPTTMLGALLGSYTNKLFPTWLTSCLMAALLVFLTYKLLLRGVNTFVKESHDKLLERRQQQQQQHGDGLTAPLLAHAHDQDTADADADDTDAAAAPGTAALGSSKHQHAGGDAQSAWMDAGAAGDQSAAAAQQYGSGEGGSEHAPSSPPAAAADVLPVPAGLKSLSVGARGAAAGAAVAVQQHQDGNHQQPGRACSVSSTPHHAPGSRASCDGIISPLVWSNPPSATAADAEAAAACEFSNSRQTQQKQKHQQQRRQALLLPRHTASGDGSSAGSKKAPRVCSLCSCLDPARLQLSTVQAYARQQLPWQPLLVLFLLSCWVVASDTGKATLACGSLRYWAVVLSVVPPCLMVTLVVRQWLLARTAVEAAAAAAVGSASPAPAVMRSAAAAAAAAAQRKAGMIHWTPRNSITYPLICSMAGIFAGLFGVGGGIVKGPLMLELGVLPDVAAATSATMIMFTAGSAAIVYLNFGGVVMDYAQALLLLGFCVTLAGQLVATHLVRVLKRRSIIIFAMGLLMLLASIAAVYQMGLSTLSAYQHPPMWKWGSICQHR